jgi:hypothetical protein
MLRISGFLLWQTLQAAGAEEEKRRARRNGNSTTSSFMRAVYLLGFIIGMM